MRASVTSTGVSDGMTNVSPVTGTAAATTAAASVLSRDSAMHAAHGGCVAARAHPAPRTRHTMAWTARVIDRRHTRQARPFGLRAYNVLLLPMDSSSALAPTSLAVR